jgi:transposase
VKSQEQRVMMGTKDRSFAALPPVTLEDLIPPDFFYRHLERSLDLGFVRDLVRDTYADSGRPSIDPVVFFTRQLILFFEGLRSERQLMEVVADRLSLRWYLGDDLTESLPDHSSLSRIRERYGLDIFRRFFERLVEPCLAAGLVWGQELYIDATKVAANAALDSRQPRFAVEAHLAQLFAQEDDGDGEDRTDDPDGTGSDALHSPTVRRSATIGLAALVALPERRRAGRIGGRPISGSAPPTPRPA